MAALTMKKLLLVVLLAGGAVLGYRHVASHAAEAAYRRFAETMLQRDYNAAAALADGLSAGDLEKLGSQERIGAGPPMFQTLFPSKFAVDSREASPDGSVTLRATQTVLFNPAGVESAMPAMYAKLRQVVTLKKSAGAWRVTAFTNDFESMDTVRRR
jgi:hypothetical protein